MKSRQAGFTQALSAAKAGISVRSGRRVEKGERPAIQGEAGGRPTSWPPLFKAL